MLKNMGKLAMPARKPAPDAIEIEVGEESPEAPEAPEGEEEMPMDLSALSDNELIAECKRRNLKLA